LFKWISFHIQQDLPQLSSCKSITLALTDHRQPQSFGYPFDPYNFFQIWRKGEIWWILLVLS